MNEEIPVGLSFDDVFLVPRKSEVLPTQIELSTRFTESIHLNLPILSAAMDTVTEHELAITMARHGGLGVIHRNCSIEQQCSFVEQVKRSENIVIQDPITARPRSTIGEVTRLMDENRISGIPVIDGEGTLLGMITRRDVRFVDEMGRPVTDVMTPAEELVTAPPGINLEEARGILHEHNVEKLPLVDGAGVLEGMMTGKDIEKRTRFPDANYDDRGRLRVAAAIGVSGDGLHRAGKLVELGCDALVIDAATGHTGHVRTVLKRLRDEMGDIPVVAGNVATRQGARDLIEWGASAVKVGLGPGSICTTRMVSGVGVPQFTAIRNAAEVCRSAGVPLIADGGIRSSGDILKALAAGADTIMAGSLFAGTEESPGETVQWLGRAYKEYRGLGSRGAMKEGARDLYAKSDSGKVTPEGVEARVPYKGPLQNVIRHLMGGLRSGMGYVGASSLAELRERAEFIRVTSGGLRESRPHDVVVTENSSQPAVAEGAPGENLATNGAG